MTITWFRGILPAVVFSLAISASPADDMHHVSSRVPVVGSSRELAAERPEIPSAPRTHDVVGPAANPWKLLATLPGAVLHDISFATPKIGYAAAELGQVWKTTNGGTSWTEVLNLGFPYYFYGVQAAGANDVAISGFNDSNFESIIRFSHDGGVSWTSDIVLSTSGWANRVRYVNPHDGLVMDQLNLNAANAAHYTTDGGAAATDWTAVVPDPNGGWFGNQFSFLPNLHARASGITYCTSLNGGADWSCAPAIDPVFDGPTFFSNDSFGWVGGGEISPNVEGWVHRTTDGGQTWSGRTLDIGWPIREILFLTPSIGWAAGGNVYSGVGGMYFSKDGGQTWSQDASTGAEMSSCDTKHSGKRVQVWCAGYNLTNNAFNGVIYSVRGTLP
ncbi:MAG: WD40/YVTN/BNR-like repeat-containing protein [Terriglobales bacterium]